MYIFDIYIFIEKCIFNFRSKFLGLPFPDGGILVDKFLGSVSCDVPEGDKTIGKKSSSPSSCLFWFDYEANIITKDGKETLDPSNPIEVTSRNITQFVGRKYPNLHVLNSF